MFTSFKYNLLHDKEFGHDIRLGRYKLHSISEKSGMRLLLAYEVRIYFRAMLKNGFLSLSNIQENNNENVHNIVVFQTAVSFIF